MAIDKNSSTYKSILAKGYTDAEIEQMYNEVNSGKSAKDVVASMNAQKANSASTNISSNVAKPEYQGSGTSSAKQSTYQNQGSGNYSYNSKTGYYEKNGTQTNNQTSSSSSANNTYQNQGAGNYVYNNNTGYYEKVGTQAATSSSMDSTRKAWDNLTYEQQQQKLKDNPSLKQALAQKGWTIKSANGTSTVQSSYQNQGAGNYVYNDKTGYYEKLDYQDNSPERLQQIYDNLNRYRITNPELFDNWETFSNFFINGLNRSPEQLEVLRNYYDSVKKYNGYDNLSPNTVGNLIAHGEVPDDYLNYLKVNDPQRYAEIMASKNEAEAGIMNESYYSTLLENSGEPDWMKWAKENQFLIDRNNDDLDDRLYHAMSPEEQSYRDEINSLQADNLKYENAIRNLDSDLTEQYPDADLSTIMILRSDRGSKIQKQIDANNVTLTKLQGTVNYMQSERQAQDKAGQQTINELQESYGMYFQYTPEGMSQLAQAQYAATNVTLDQADVGTDTQKQMALQSVLDGYYDKYGSIIQRSESQVIGDVMAYAKEKGISLSQALEENFLKPLRSKPQFQTLSSGGITPNVSLQKIGDTGYVFTVNPDGTYSIEQVGDVTGTGTGTMRTERNNNPTAMTTDVAKSLGLVEGVDYVQGDAFPNNPNLHTAKLIGDPIETTIKALDNGANSSSTHAFYTAGNKQRWTHTAMSDAEWLKLSDDQKKQVVLNMLQREGGDISKMAYYNEGGNGGNAGNGGNYDPALEPFFKADPAKFTSTQWKQIEKMGYTNKQFLNMRTNYLKNMASTPDASTTDILDKIGYLITNYPGRTELMAGGVSSWLPGEYGGEMGDYMSYLNQIKQSLTMKNLTYLKSQGATFGSLTEGERPRIEASATALGAKQSEQKFKEELLYIYNAYAEPAGMGKLTLDDINNMYGNGNLSQKQSNGSFSRINTPSYVKSTQTQSNQNSDIDRDAEWASIQG